MRAGGLSTPRESATAQTFDILGSDEKSGGDHGSYPAVILSVLFCSSFCFFAREGPLVWELGLLSKFEKGGSRIPVGQGWAAGGVWSSQIASEQI